MSRSSSALAGTNTVQMKWLARTPGVLVFVALVALLDRRTASHAPVGLELRQRPSQVSFIDSAKTMF